HPGEHPARLAVEPGARVPAGAARRRDATRGHAGRRGNRRDRPRRAVARGLGCGGARDRGASIPGGPTGCGGPEMTMPPMPFPARGTPPGPRLMTSLVVTGVGLAIAFVSVVAIVIPLLGTFTSSSYAVPGDLRLHLHHARYTVYQHTGSRSPFGTGSDDP